MSSASTFADAVLAVLSDGRRLKSAYEIAAELSEQRGRNVPPPQVYRALRGLTVRGLVLRVESRGSYLCRKTPAAERVSAVLLCTRCGKAEELEIAAAGHLLDACAAARGFQVYRRVLELEGECDDCSSSLVGLA